MVNKKQIVVVAVILTAIGIAAYLLRDKLATLLAKLRGIIPSPNGLPTLKAGSITFTASNSADTFPRDWNVFEGDAVGTIVSGMTYQPAPKIQEVHTQGESMQVVLEPGTYTFQIGQSGGAAYGTYSGKAVDSEGNEVPFEGIMLTKGITFKVE